MYRFTILFRNKKRIYKTAIHITDIKFGIRKNKQMIRLIFNKRNYSRLSRNIYGIFLLLLSERIPCQLLLCGY